MKSAAKAKQLGIKRDTLMKTPEKYGGVQMGSGEWVFPNSDSVGATADDEPGFVYPEIEESERMLKYHQAMKAKEEHIKVKTANAVARGTFVERRGLEDAWRKHGAFVKSELMALTGRVKNRAGELLTAEAEQILEDLLYETMDKISKGAK